MAGTAKTLAGKTLAGMTLTAALAAATAFAGACAGAAFTMRRVMRLVGRALCLAARLMTLAARTAFATAFRHGGGSSGGCGKRLVGAPVARRDGLARHFLDVAQQVALILGAECNCRTGRARAGGSTDAVDIRFRHVRQLELDDMGDSVDVDAARRDISRHQGADVAGLEGGKRALALRLALVAVDGGSVDAGLLERLGDTIGAALGASEHQDPRETRVGEQLVEQGAFAPSFDEHDLLRHALGRRRLRSDGDLQRIMQQLAGQLGDVGWHGGGEEQVLPFHVHVRHDLADRRQEAEVEHLVGFVEHQDFGVLKLGVLFLEVIDQASRRGDEDVEAASQRLDLLAVLHAAEHHRHLEAKVFAIGAEAVSDLGRQLAGGRQDQSAAAPTRRRAWVGLQEVEDGEGKGGGLAGAGLSDAQKVAAGHDAGNGLRLDRRGDRVTFGGQSQEERLGEAKVGKLSQNECPSDMRHVRARIRDAARRNDDFMGNCPAWRAAL